MSLAKIGLSFFGIASFAKSPCVPVDGEWEADVGVLGIPFDQAVGFRSGARFGPKAIRDMSVRYSFYQDGDGFYDMRSQSRRGLCRAVDCGDAEVIPLDFEQSFANITAAVKQIRGRNAFPLVLGGDHSVTLPVIRAFEGEEPITIVHFDAHTDFRDTVGGVRYGHGSVIRRVTELGWVERCVSLGIRSVRTREEDLKAMLSGGHTIIPSWKIHEGGAASIAERLPENRRVYITFDIDAMDPSIAPGTGTPEVGGLLYEQARALLDLVCERNTIVGMDVVEVNPLYDPTQITGLLAAQLITDVMGFVFRGS